jgi:hypothetical protein
MSMLPFPILPRPRRPRPPAGGGGAWCATSLLNLLRGLHARIQLALTVGSTCGLIPMLGVTSLLVAAFRAVRECSRHAAHCAFTSWCSCWLLFPCCGWGWALGYYAGDTGKLRTLFSHDWLAALN